MELIIRPITLEAFISITEGSSEKFFKKMKRGLVDDNCQDLILCAYDGETPLGFIATKQVRNYANLKWIATLPEARGKGAFRALCENAVNNAYKAGLEYFRVSINAPALGAYKKVGFEVLGEQRSNCFLSIGQLKDGSVSGMDWSIDETIWKMANQKPRGGCIVLYIDKPITNQLKLEL